LNPFGRAGHALTHRSVAARKPIVAVAFYSTYGHIATLAEAIIKGVEASGAEVRPYFMYVYTSMHASDAWADLTARRPSRKRSSPRCTPARRSSPSTPFSPPTP
jgi:hypothetical protein